MGPDSNTLLYVLGLALIVGGVLTVWPVAVVGLVVLVVAVLREDTPSSSL